MREIIDLVPFVNAPEWGAWEPLALTMILAGGVSTLGAGIAVLRRAKPFMVYVLAVAAISSLACGLLGVFVPLEQPLRVWEFAAILPSAPGQPGEPTFCPCAFCALWFWFGRAAKNSRSTAALHLRPCVLVFWPWPTPQARYGPV